jgi:hypothetical protein
VDVAAIIKRSRVVNVGDVSVRVPSVEDLLLHTCLHFAWSNKLWRGGWRAYADAHAILADPAFNWDRFIPVATSQRARQCCYWTLRVGRAVADLCVPHEVLTRLDPSSGGRLANLLERHFAMQIADPTAAESVAHKVRRWLWFTAMHERSTSAEAVKMWNEGAVEVPGEDATSRAPRGTFRIAASTLGYFARLVSRG